MAFGEVVVTQMPSQHRMTDWAFVQAGHKFVSERSCLVE